MDAIRVIWHVLLRVVQHFSGTNNITLNAGATVFNSSLYIDSPGLTGSYLSLFGAYNSSIATPAQNPAAQMNVQGESTTIPNQGTLHIYARQI